MKNIVIICLILFSISLIFAAEQGSQARIGNFQDTGIEDSTSTDVGVSENIRVGNYINSQNKAMRIETIRNRIRIHSGNAFADCDCNLTKEQKQNKTNLHMRLSNGRNAEVKIMPDTASETALARLRIRNCNESNNCTIMLKEVGKNNETRAGYEMQIQRHSRILGLFRAKMQIRTQVDAETGEVLRVRKAWWAFLASEPAEE